MNVLLLCLFIDSVGFMRKERRRQWPNKELPSPCSVVGHEYPQCDPYCCQWCHEVRTFEAAGRRLRGVDGYEVGSYWIAADAVVSARPPIAPGSDTRMLTIKAGTKAYPAGTSWVAGAQPPAKVLT